MEAKKLINSERRWGGDAQTIFRSIHWEGVVHRWCLQAETHPSSSDCARVYACAHASCPNARTSLLLLLLLPYFRNLSKLRVWRVEDTEDYFHRGKSAWHRADPTGRQRSVGQQVSRAAGALCQTLPESVRVSRILLFDPQSRGMTPSSCLPAAAAAAKRTRWGWGGRGSLSSTRSFKVQHFSKMPPAFGARHAVRLETNPG